MIMSPVRRARGAEGEGAMEVDRAASPTRNAPERYDEAVHDEQAAQQLRADAVGTIEAIREKILGVVSPEVMEQVKRQLGTLVKEVATKVRQGLMEGMEARSPVAIPRAELQELIRGAVREQVVEMTAAKTGGRLWASVAAAAAAREGLAKAVRPPKAVPARHGREVTVRAPAQSAEQATLSAK